ncbi:MAG TPA: DoxX family protein [Terriglobales bacterium]
MSKARKIALWIVSILVATMFLLTGSFGLLFPGKVHEGFVHYGYSAWFGTFIAACELLGGIGLLVPRLAAVAATGLSIIMVGAFFTHVSHHEYSYTPGPLVLLILLLVVIYMRVKEVRA